jgi:mannose-6-phosphate isomerase-like protein (cupin superfamily)
VLALDPDALNEHLRKLDVGALAAREGRVVERLIDRSSGATGCAVLCIKTPVGDGSPEGLHRHAVDQIFYVLSGTMSVEVAGRSHEAGPGTLVFFPAGVPHRNWNEGSQPTLHLAINAPLPEEGVPFATPAEG